MTTNLADMVESFRREVAIPGTFDAVYPDTSEAQILGALADAFAEVRLDGFLGDQVLDLNTYDVEPGLDVALQALVVIYAGMRLIRAEIRAANTVTRYKAGPVEYETQKSATGLVQMLKELTERKGELLRALRTGIALDVMLDAYNGRWGTRFLVPQYRPSIYG